MSAAASGTASSGGERGHRRTVARLAAVQALYQLALRPGLEAAVVIREFVAHRLGREIDGDQYGEADAGWFAEIVEGVTGDRERIDAAISVALTEEWPLHRLETILRAILEAGTFELAHRTDVPPRVAISEYVGIAHAFFSGKEPGLANGVLDRIARTLREADLTSA